MFLNSRVWAWLVTVLLVSLGACKPKSAPVVVETQTPRVDLFVEDLTPPQSETWEAHYVRNAKVGHRHTQIFDVGTSDRPLIKIVATDILQFRRFGTVSEQELTMISLETPAGDVRQFAYRLRCETSETVVKGTVDGEQLRLMRLGSKQPQLRLPWSDRQHGLFAIKRSLQLNPMHAGERRTVDSFVALADRIVSYNLVAKEKEETDVAGQSRRLLRIDTIDQRASGWKLPTSYWTDEDGRILKMREAHLDRETIVLNRDTALKANDLFKLDLGSDVGIPVSTPIKQPDQLKQALYRVRTDDLQPADVFPVSPSQQVTPAEPGVAMVRVTKATATTPEQLDQISPPTPEDLAPNELIQSNHPRVVSLANAVAESIEDPWEAAIRLEQYIYQILEKEDYAQIFNSAGEVAERRTGDCSEHAVLLAATCRARQIPAKVVVGLIYAPRSQSFLYHMWTEVWINDRWIPLDATRGQGGINATYLKFRDSNLARETAYNFVTPVMYLIDRLHIEVITAET